MFQNDMSNLTLNFLRVHNYKQCLLPNINLRWYIPETSTHISDRPYVLLSPLFV